MPFIEFLSDILLGGGALGAMIYCWVLARRLSTFSDLEKGMGGAIAVLSVQVDDMTKALGKAQVSSSETRADLEALVERAEKASTRLELLMASMHDLPPAAGSATSDPLKQTPKPVEPNDVAQNAAPPQWRRHRMQGG